MPRQVREHRLPLGLAGLGVALAQKYFCAGFVKILPEVKPPRLPAGESTLAAADRPAREDLGEGRDILLRIAAVHPERMQLQNLSCQILIDAELALRRGARRSAPGGPLRSRRIGADRVLIVEKGNHRRMLFNRRQQFH
jgi:hypothetical protein